MAGSKADGAFRTIGELAAELGVAQHILRYWETKFPLKPLQRAGNRRYYRPADVALARRINELLNRDGYTVRGVQKLLRDKSGDVLQADEPLPEPPPQTFAGERETAAEPAGVDVFRLIALRNRLAAALEG